jgi:hypothetical protein
MAPTKAVPAVDPTTLLADLDVQRARVAARLETVADTITAFRTRGAEIKTETDGRKRAALRAGEDADVASLEAERTAGEVAIIELTRERGQIVMTERELEQDRLGIYREHHEAFLELAAEAVTVGNQLLGELMAAATSVLDHRDEIKHRVARAEMGLTDGEARREVREHHQPWTGAARSSQTAFWDALDDLRAGEFDAPMSSTGAPKTFTIPADVAEV